MKGTFTLLVLTILNIINPLKAAAQKANVADSLVLVDLYNSTNGGNWTNHSGWLTGPVSKWPGVTLDNNGSVTNISLSRNNLKGGIPNSIGGLTHLQYLDISNNYLTFDGMETVALKFKFAVYWPQLTVLPIHNSRGTLTVVPGGTLSNNSYTWYKNSQEFTIIPGLPSYMPTTLGKYTVEVHNAIADKLTLYSDTFALTKPANEQDSLALVDLYDSTNGANWTYHFGWLARPLSEWYGVDVDTNGRVSNISLPNNKINGSLPASLGNLANLQYVDLSYNGLDGSIPDFWGSLGYLTYIDLGGNKLDGGIPTSLGSLANLNILNLGGNKLSGAIPASLASLHNLQTLTLGGNQLSGGIPTSLGSLGSLQYLELAYNQLSGSIPTELSNLAKLQGLRLEGNQLSGSIPTELSNLAKLQGLSLGSNQLSGSIPAELGNLANLAFLDLSGNQLNSSIPASLGKLANLTNLYLNNNQLSGNIPASLGNLTTLTNLYLNNNQLSGSIPASLGNLANLLWLNLFNNQLSGNIPSSLGNLTLLWYLDIYNNYFTFNGMEAIAQKFRNSIYAPQHSIPLHVSNKKLSVYAGGTLNNNTYNWYNGHTLVKTAIGDSTFTPTAAGTYNVAITNSVAKALTLHSDTLTLGDSLILAARPSTEYASYEYTDTLGWTHYYYNNNTPNDLADDTLLLSLKKNGQDIGTVGDGTFAVKLVATAGAGSNTGIKVTNPLITNTSGYWVMNRYWQVTPTHEPAKSVGVRFYYNNQDLKDVNGSYPTHNLTNNKIIFFKAVGGNPDPTTNLAGATNIISILPGIVASDTSWTYHVLSDTTQYGEYSVASFSGGGGGGTGNNEALPVTRLNFTGQLTHNTALLNWQTTTEINTAYFNIQRSVDGVKFSTVGKVTAAGHSTNTKDYQFTDALAGLNPLPSQLFYRLQVADKDGAVSYSKIIVLNSNPLNTPATLIYPNPAHDVLNVRLNGFTGKVSVTITNAEGKLLQTRQYGSVASGEAATINTSTLAAGVYMLRIQYDGKSVVQKFVKY